MALRRLLSRGRLGSKREVPRTTRSPFGRLTMPPVEEAPPPESPGRSSAESASAPPRDDESVTAADETPPGASASAPPGETTATADERVQAVMSQQPTRPMPIVTRPRRRATTGRPASATRPNWKDALWGQAGAAGLLQPGASLERVQSGGAGSPDGAPGTPGGSNLATPLARLQSAARRITGSASRLRRNPRFPPLPGERRRLWFRLANAGLLLVVVLLAVAGVLSASTRVAELRGQAEDGFAHIERLHALAPSPHALLDALALDAAADSVAGAGRARVQEIQGELAAAERDFAALRRDLDAPGGALFLATRAPGADATLAAARSLAAAADEACLAGLALVPAAPIVTGALAGGIVDAGRDPRPALTADSIATMRRAVDGALAHLRAAVLVAQRADLQPLAGLLPPAELAQVRAMVASWPALVQRLERLRAWLDVLPQVLGIGSSATYLLEVLDRAELRPTGGFIDNYSLLTVADGRVQPFTLSDPHLLDAAFLAEHGDTSPAPAAYGWWPWASQFTLHDSNLSPDFPTAARVAMTQLHLEGGPEVQGVLAVTAPFVQQLLRITGPVVVPDYGETVSSDDVEGAVHAHEGQATYAPTGSFPAGDQVSSLRRRFTALLGRALLAKMQTLSPSQTLAVARLTLADLQTKDVQVYFADAGAHALLGAAGLDGALARDAADAVTIVDANTSGNKANEFVAVAYADTVTLDPGGATHALDITYTFHASDPAALYGPDEYMTYLRVYVPARSHLISLDGLSNIYGADQLGASDELGRQMWGGFVRVRDGAGATVRLSWTVPAVQAADPGASAYRLVYQHQAGSAQTLHLAVLRAGASGTALTYDGPLDRDRVFTLG